ncbi:MAG: hypothetical protein IPG89_13910 [Bacteroidetes bacterium]|nr:hypothetical protein [Bacteroidota bacterium]
MGNDEYVSVDKLIESGEYKPEICNGTFDKLIKTVPPTIKISATKNLNELLNKWANEEEAYRWANGDSIKFAHNQKNIYELTKYKYTYILAGSPTHVFSTCTTVWHYKERDYFPLFIRIDEHGNIVGEYTDSGIIQNPCDKDLNCDSF